MPIELWKLPVPASALTKGPNFVVLPRRQCEISFQAEDDNGEILEKALLFEGVEAFRVTYISSLDADLINAAYGKLVDLGETPWLIDAKQKSMSYYTSTKKIPPALQHLVVCFDDGPCFEIICAGFKPTQ